MNLLQGPTIKRGASFTAVLDAIAGDADGAVVTAWLKRAIDGKPPGDDAPKAAEFTVTFDAEIDRGDGTSGPGWYLRLAAADTLPLMPDTHLMDVRIEIAADVKYTPTYRLSVTERVTEQAGG